MTASVPPVFAEQYDVLREIGAGGMATVYLARDRKHDRTVAVKVIRPTVAGSVEMDRFRREVAIASGLQHPHLVPVYDSGMTDGLPWYVMPFVEGESLRDRLRREIQLPVADAVRIGEEVAGALAYAHARGVVHRDIKPENILLDTGGRALVADFGIARALDGGGAATLTATGLALGTPAYMSPEQATGETTLDARTDVYALGCVLYEMLAGEPPFTGPTPQAVLAKRFLVTPAPLRVTRESVPPALEATIARAMARVPADRFRSAAELAAALAASLGDTTGAATPAARTAGGAARPAGRWRTPLAVGLVAALAAAGALELVRRTRGASEAGAGGADVASVAVLPFDNVGETPDSAFADAVADEVRGKLAAIATLRVIASTSSAKYRGRAVPAADIGRELGVRYLVLGRVRWEPARVGDRRRRVRVDPELIQVGGVAVPAARWAEPISATTDDLFALQSEIATRVAQRLGIALAAGDTVRLRRAPARSRDAYQAYQRGRAIVVAQGTVPAGLRASVVEYERAIGLDSGYALAWAGIASTLSILHAVTGGQDPQIPARAQAALERAQLLAPAMPEVFRARGVFASRVLRDHRRALEAYREGLRVAPHDVALLSAAAVTHLALGAADSALALLGTAERVDPLAPQVQANRQLAALRVHDATTARSAGDRALALAPASLSVRQYRAVAELQQGRLDSARAVVSAAPPSVSRDALVAYMASFHELFWLLDDARQRALLTLGPEAFDGDRGGWALALAGTHALRGDSGRARAYADSARRAFDTQLAAAPDDPMLHVGKALALAYRRAPGDSAAAAREGELAASLTPLDQDTWNGGYVRYALARVYALTGARAQAVAQLAQVLRLPYLLTPGWLRVDPAFAPLRRDPAFARIAGA